MLYFSMTDRAISTEIGKRLSALRLRKNLPQHEVASMTGLSLKAIRSAEKGESKLITYIKILRALNALDDLDHFLPDISISPLQLAKTKGKQRQRATSSRKRIRVAD